MLVGRALRGERRWWGGRGGEGCRLLRGFLWRRTELLVSGFGSIGERVDFDDV